MGVKCGYKKRQLQMLSGEMQNENCACFVERTSDAHLYPRSVLSEE